MEVTDETFYVDAIWRRLVLVRKAGRRAAQHGDRPLDVATLDMCDPDRELRKGLPQCPLLDRPVLPCRLEHLMRIERQAPIQQVLRIVESLGGRQFEVIWDARNALAALRKRPAKGVARTAASGPAGFVAITLSHMPMIANVHAELWQGNVREGGFEPPRP